MEELDSVPEPSSEHVVRPQPRLPKPINTARIALYMVIAICLLGLISNIAHFGSASAARNMPKSLQPAKPGVTSLDALAGFQRQQAEDALRLEKEREAGERLLGSASESLQRSKESTLLPCDAALAGTQGTAPDGTPIIRTADGFWRPMRPAGMNTPAGSGVSPAQEEAQRRRAEREHRLQEALASSSLAIDFTDANAPNQASGERPAPTNTDERPVPPIAVSPSTAPHAPEPAPIAPAQKPKYEWATYS